MQIVFFGTGDFGVPVLRALVAAGHTVACAVSQPDRPAGRGRRVEPTPIHVAADELEIPHMQTNDVNTLASAGFSPNADIGVVVAFGQKLGPGVLTLFPHGCVNIHASLLPKYRGAAPYQWAILNGEATTGVTVFQLNEQWDAGAIWGVRETPIDETETADELHDRLAALGAELIIDVLPRIAGGLSTPKPQSVSAATRAPKLRKSDGLIDWSRPADEVARWINGLWSWPGATCEFVSRSGKRERLQLARARVANRGSAGSMRHPESDPPASGLLTSTLIFSPGAFRPDGTVQTGAGCVALLEVKPAGGKLMPFSSFANGRRVAPPDRLERPVET